MDLLPAGDHRQHFWPICPISNPIDFILICDWKLPNYSPRDMCISVRRCVHSCVPRRRAHLSPKWTLSLRIRRNVSYASAKSRLDLVPWQTVLSVRRKNVVGNGRFLRSASLMAIPISEMCRFFFNPLFVIYWDGYFKNYSHIRDAVVQYARLMIRSVRQ